MSNEQPDVPPPRYEPDGNFKRLICDEQEWLARPAPWGIDQLPEEVRARKQNLRNAYQCGWLATFITCPECGPRVRSLFRDEGYWFAEDDAESWDLDAHAAPAPCDADQVRKAVRNHRRGIVCHSEMVNGFWNGLFDNFHRRAQEARLTGRSLDRERRDRDRWLALELVGPNPFRPIAFDPAWRTDTAVALARGVYESQDFSAMPILADALQDAGCDSDAVLSHCRDPQGVHVRGCWVIDLVLGKA